MLITFKYALAFIEEMTPMSIEIEKNILARRLVFICDKYNKSPEEAWAFTPYWMGC